MNLKLSGLHLSISAPYLSYQPNSAQLEIKKEMGLYQPL
jgi:hypothetical protein